jgi:phosphoribosylaminoimidazole-succinocarboxamide synthase
LGAAVGNGRQFSVAHHALHVLEVEGSATPRRAAAVWMPRRCRLDAAPLPSACRAVAVCVPPLPSACRAAGVCVPRRAVAAVTAPRATSDAGCGVGVLPPSGRFLVRSGSGGDGFRTSSRVVLTEEVELTLLRSELPGLPRREGKVRDIYDLGDRLILVATDRLSAFDWVLPTGIPDKGRVLTGLSAFWFGLLKVPHHLISIAVEDFPPAVAAEDRELLRGRAMLVRKARVIPFECVVRGYLAGSGWKSYQATGEICGVSLPPGLVESARIEPIFTPATKAETGHDENIPFSVLRAAVGIEVAETLRSLSLEIYQTAAAHAQERGLILADTKLEWGYDHRSGELLLVDELLTPDSSRYWSAEAYRPGGPQPSFDKQFVRDWLERSGWDKSSPPPELPPEVVAGTRARYIEAFERLTGSSFPWK